MATLQEAVQAAMNRPGTTILAPEGFDHEVIRYHFPRPEAVVRRTADVVRTRSDIAPTFERSPVMMLIASCDFHRLADDPTLTDLVRTTREHEHLRVRVVVVDDVEATEQNRH
jgi:hypothetical protein